MSLALVAALGLLIGVALGALGGGGSILAVPVLAHLAGQSASAATATSLVAVGAGAAAGAFGHYRAGHVRWAPAAAFVVTGILGSWLGAELNGRLDGDVLLLVFSGLVLVAAHRMLTACPSCTRVGEEEAYAEAARAGGDDVDGGGAPAAGTLVRFRTSAPPTGRIVRVVAAGSTVGFLTGLFGVGGGFVIVPALTLALGLSMPAAIGTSLVVIVGNALVALGFRGVDAVDWGVAVPFAGALLAGSLVGSLVGHRLPPRRTLHAFALLLVLVAVGNAAAALVALY
ncbi:MAG TPA: sulfite exporter TauE/SafE family protein [Acidimicrobiales bacterium]|nr:sulfite exporter TauE/SafE family protein [Acidimicrobiales bacterium]